MEIAVIDESNYLKENQDTLIQEVIAQAAQHLNLGEDYEVDISIVSDQEIHELNRTYRGIDRPTDVLSFALEETTEDDPLGQVALPTDLGRFLGDIIISYPRTQAQAEDYGHSLERELAFLAVHGFLHLNGYDHQSPEEEAEMFGLQEEVLTEYGLQR